MSEVNLEKQNEHVNAGMEQANSDLNAANANVVEEPDEYEFEVADATQGQAKQDPATNRAFMLARIERKRQKKLEEEIERLKRGEISEDMRVAPELPAMPRIEDYTSDDALEKYGYDSSVAMAAFNQEMAGWQLKALDAKSVASAKQTQKVNQFIDQAGQYGNKVRQHYDVAERLNIPDFHVVEERVSSALPQGWANSIIDLFPEKSAAIFAHLDKNPAKLAQFANMNPQYATVELTRLADSMTIKPKQKISKAPEPDEILNASGGASSDVLKAMEKAAKEGNVSLYRELKAKL